METRSLVDASPLQALLEQVLKPVSGVLAGIHENLLERRLRAVAHYDIELFYGPVGNLGPGDKFSALDTRPP